MNAKPVQRRQQGSSQDTWNITNTEEARRQQPSMYRVSGGRQEPKHSGDLMALQKMYEKMLDIKGAVGSTIDGGTAISIDPMTCDGGTAFTTEECEADAGTV